jgi:enoyl-CoA hydratase/carnithine racemase
MKPKPFGARREDGVLWLTLDTPGCEVNVFSQDAATQLLELLVPAQRGDVRAVVFESNKPGSFVNGVGLMMANTAKRPEDARELTVTVREAYRAVRELPVPAICAIRGNCYGCGVEFALHSAFRVAERSQDTHFYMTEIADYLFLPTFGSTQDLPRVVGLDSAIDLLLWGARWTADEARAHGLVDAAFDRAEFSAELRNFVDEVLSGKRTRHRASLHPDVAPTVDKTKARIERLPPSYRELYTTGLELLVRGAAAQEGDRAGYDAEVDACGLSLMNPMAKAALSTFFVRQLAKAVSLRGARSGIERLELAQLPALSRDLAERRVRDLEVVDAQAEAASEGAIRLVAYGAGASGSDVAVALAPIRARTKWASDVMAYAPLYRVGNGLFEVAQRNGVCAAATCAEALRRAGFTAVVTRPTVNLLLDDLSAAFFDPIRMFLAAGGKAATVGRTLRDFGFVQSAVALGQWLEAGLKLKETNLENATPDPALLDAVLTSLLGFAAAAVEARNVPHPSIVDVMARELLDFPLGHGTLCSYLTLARSAELLAGTDRFAHIVGPLALENARKFAKDAKAFYR